MRANDKEKVREHYDRMSPYYHSLCLPGHYQGQGIVGGGGTNGPAFVRFLRAFKDVRAGFASGNFVYGLMVAKVRD